ncbi:unnamed protein product [Closterium sp. NIES-54]
MWDPKSNTIFTTRDAKFMEGLMFKEWSERGRSKVTIPLGIEVGTNDPLLIPIELSSSSELTEVSHDLGGADREAADVEALQQGEARIAETSDTEEEVQQPTPSPKLPSRRTTQGKRDAVRGGAKEGAAKERPKRAAHPRDFLKYERLGVPKALLVQEEEYEEKGAEGEMEQICCFGVNLPHEPASMEEALAGDDREAWLASREDEFQSHMENETWTLTNLPPGRKALDSTWVLRVKTDAEGRLERRKARLVIKGFQQREGIEFQEVFAPVAKAPTLRLLLAAAAVCGWKVEQIDVKTEFLYGVVDEEIYMKQPEGYDDGSGLSLVDPSGGPVLAHSSTVLPCPAAPSGLLSGLHLPSFSTNLVSGADLQDLWVDQFIPGGHCVTHCTCSRTGRHLATFTRRLGSSLYTLTTASPPVTASGQVAAYGQVFAPASKSSTVTTPCSCRPLSHETLLWHHRLGHPSLPRLRGMASRTLVSGLPRSLPPLPPGPAPTCVPCVEGRQRAAPHSSEFPPTEAPLQTLHMDVWGPARVRGQGHERYFLLVVDDYSRYTTVFPLCRKGEVTEVLIDWIRGARRQLSESFGSNLPVLRMHSDRGGEFSSDLLRAFCCAEGIRQTFTLPASPQQNGIAEHRIGMVMDVARTSMIHAAAPHFMWPFAVQYAAHQINLQPRVSLLETTPTPRWTGKVGDASVFRVWGSRAFVRDASADKLSSHAVPCDVTFDDSVSYYRLFPYRTASLPPPATLPSTRCSSAVNSGAARGAEPAGAGPGGAAPGVAESGVLSLGGKICRNFVGADTCETIVGLRCGQQEGSWNLFLGADEMSQGSGDVAEKRNEPPPSKIEALDGSNYEEWSGRMRSAFKHYKLLKLAMGEEKMPKEGDARDRWIEKSAVLYDLILQTVNNDMFQHIKDLVQLIDSGPKAWKLLRDVIQPNTLPMVIVLEKELAALSMRPGDDVKPIFDKIEDTYARMAAAGSNVSQIQQCTKIISVLDNSWENLIPTLNTQQDQ